MVRLRSTTNKDKSLHALIKLGAPVMAVTGKSLSGIFISGAHKMLSLRSQVFFLPHRNLRIAPGTLGTVEEGWTRVPAPRWIRTSINELIKSTISPETDNISYDT